MVDNQTLSKAATDTTPDWHEGECSRCERETRVLSVNHKGYGELCLVCADREAEDGDMSALVGGA